jgi:hypothetical protein
MCSQSTGACPLLRRAPTLPARARRLRRALGRLPDGDAAAGAHGQPRGRVAVLRDRARLRDGRGLAAGARGAARAGPRVSCPPRASVLAARAGPGRGAGTRGRAACPEACTVLCSTWQCSNRGPNCEHVWPIRPLEAHAARVRPQEYKERAVELGLDHAKRESLRARLKAARLTCPLFDTAGWVADFERVLQRMWAIHCEGRGPRAFEVSAAGTGA